MNLSILRQLGVAAFLSFLCTFSFADTVAIDINSATVEQLSQLKGIGRVKAERIVRYRTDHGPFDSIEQILEVKGIGSAILDKNRELIAVSVNKVVPTGSATE